MVTTDTQTKGIVNSPSYNCHWSSFFPAASSTRTPTLQCLIRMLHFCRHWRVQRTFLYLFQNSLKVIVKSRIFGGCILMVHISTMYLGGIEGSTPWLGLRQKKYLESRGSKFWLNIWAPIQIQWYRNTSGYNTGDVLCSFPMFVAINIWYRKNSRALHNYSYRFIGLSGIILLISLKISQLSKRLLLISQLSKT